MQAESLAKAYILTHGVRFTDDALLLAAERNAKRQNSVYNLPATPAEEEQDRRSLPVLSFKDRTSRPQELFLSGEDGYTVCVSAVSPVPIRESAIVGVVDGNLLLTTPAKPSIGRALSEVAFVPQPNYYASQNSSGRSVTRWVSACGYDEMNVWPWHDCAISRPCTFCGINTVQKLSGRDADLLHSLDIRREANVDSLWVSVRDAVISEITEAVGLAIDDECYRHEVHLILISGNLADHQLDAQARIYSDIARAITRRHPGRFAEGAVAVTAPPSDLGLLRLMRDGGIEIGVFNLEAFSPAAFALHCPGKNRIGRGHYIRALEEGVSAFGWGRSWCNFVLGLEPLADLLAGCKELASRGITPGANVLHLDHGAIGSLVPPDFDTVITFYREIAGIYQQHNHRPYYCQLALRTSLANEAFAGRLD